MSNQKILIEIGRRLDVHKAPTETQREFLRHLGAALNDGLSIEEALAIPEPATAKRGKQSVAYRVAKLNRDMRMRQAFELLTGSPWKRCSQMIKDISRIRFALDRNEPLASDEYTQLLIRSIKTGIKPVSTTRQLYKILVSN